MPSHIFKPPPDSVAAGQNVGQNASTSASTSHNNITQTGKRLYEVGQTPVTAQTQQSQPQLIKSVSMVTAVGSTQQGSIKAQGQDSQMRGSPLDSPPASRTLRSLHRRASLTADLNHLAHSERLLHVNLRKRFLNTVYVYRTLWNGGESKDVFFLKIFDALDYEDEIEKMLKIKRDHDITKGPNLFFELFADESSRALCLDFLKWVEEDHLQAARVIEKDSQHWESIKGKKPQLSPNKDAFKQEFHGKAPQKLYRDPNINYQQNDSDDGNSNHQRILTYEELQQREETLRQEYENRYLARLKKHETLEQQNNLQKSLKKEEQDRIKQQKDFATQERLFQLREGERQRLEQLGNLTDNKVDQARKKRNNIMQENRIELLREKLSKSPVTLSPIKGSHVNQQQQPLLSLNLNPNSCKSMGPPPPLNVIVSSKSSSKQASKTQQQSPGSSSKQMSMTQQQGSKQMPIQNQIQQGSKQMPIQIQQQGSKQMSIQQGSKQMPTAPIGSKNYTAQSPGQQQLDHHQISISPKPSKIQNENSISSVQTQQVQSQTRTRNIMGGQQSLSGGPGPGNSGNTTKTSPSPFDKSSVKKAQQDLLDLHQTKIARVERDLAVKLIEKEKNLISQIKDENDEFIKTHRADNLSKTSEVFFKGKKTTIADKENVRGSANTQTTRVQINFNDTDSEDLNQNGTDNNDDDDIHDPQSPNYQGPKYSKEQLQSMAKKVKIGYMQPKKINNYITSYGEEIDEIQGRHTWNADSSDEEYKQIMKCITRENQAEMLVRNEQEKLEVKEKLIKEKKRKEKEEEKAKQKELENKNNNTNNSSKMTQILREKKLNQLNLNPDSLLGKIPEAVQMPLSQVVAPQNSFRLLKSIHSYQQSRIMASKVKILE